MNCVIDFEQNRRELRWELPEEIYRIRLECESPTGPCRCVRGCELVKRVHAQEDVDRDELILVSTRWVTGCGFINRIYLSPDGKIVVTHDYIGWPGAHIIELREDVASKIAELTDRILREIIAYIDSLLSDNPSPGEGS